MNLPKRLYIFLIILAAGTAGSVLLVSQTLTEGDKAKESFEDHYRIYSIPIPEELRFAEEKILLSDEDLKERYDKELLTNIYWQSQTLLFIKRAHKYFPVIEKILQEQGIPDDFKYLAVAESGLQWQVVSPANAASYWQFLVPTGKIFGLEVTEEVDERYHLEKATMAACRYFRMAYSQLGTWSLAAASYNMGIEGVRRQMLQQGINSYTDLYLNTETSRYLFRILAIKAILQKPASFGFHVPYTHMYKETPVVRIRVDQTIPDLAKYASDNSSNYKWIRLMNPWIKKQSLNVPTGKVYYIALPKSHINLNAYSTQVVNDTIPLVSTKFNLFR